MSNRFNNVNFARDAAERLTIETGIPHEWRTSLRPQRNGGFDPHPFVVVKTA